MRTSYSALETFRQCPKKYKFQEIDKIKTPKSKEAVFGTLVHSGLRYLFSRDPLYPSLDEVIAHFHASWSSAEIAEITEDEKIVYLTQGESIMRRFYAKNQPWNFNVLDLESRFEITVEDPKTGIVHILAGIMDRIDKSDDTHYEIIDYKTSRKMKSQDALDNDFQLSLYHLALTKRWPHIDPGAIALSLYYVKHNEKLSTARTSAQTEETKQHLLEIIRDIETRTSPDDFPPQPSALCDWCGYKAICPAWKFLFSTKQTTVSSKEDIEKRITEYFALKKQGTETTKRLVALQMEIKAYMEQEGVTRIFGDAGTISKTIQERYAYDYEKIRTTLEAHHRLDVWNALLIPDDKKLKTMLPTLPSPLKEQVLEARSIAKKFEVLSAKSKPVTS